MQGPDQEICDDGAAMESLRSFPEDEQQERESRRAAVGIEPAAEVPKSSWKGFSCAFNAFFSSMPMAAWNLGGRAPA